MADEGKWKCPVCDAENDKDFTHCRLCGVRNPALPAEARKCKSCGSIFSHETCCPSCSSPEFLQL